MFDTPPNLDEYRSVEELQRLAHDAHDEMQRMERDADGRVFDDDARSKFAGLAELRKTIAGRVAELRARQRMLAENANDPRRVERADDAYYPTRSERAEQRPGEPRHLAEAREAGLRAIERHSGALSARAGDRLEGLVRDDDPDGTSARYLAAVGHHSYLSAFKKLIQDPTSGHLRFGPQEVQAVRDVGAVERAMSIGTPSGGGYAVPFTLDPTVMLTSNGALNPVRQIARQLTISGAREWHGVASDGVTAAYVAEATVATDASPTLVQPIIITAQWRVFVPFSIELAQDWASIDSELLRLSSDARDVNDATQFLTGSGANAPGGILNIGSTGGLTTAQRVQTATVATLAVGDPWALSAAIPPRFRATTTYAAAPATLDQIFRFVGGNSTEPYQFADGDRGGSFLGRPKVEWSTMPTGATTGTKLIVGGDWSGYTIVDRLGTTAELIPHLFTASQGLLPSGQRGLYVYGRTGAGVTMPNAFRYLEVK